VLIRRETPADIGGIDEVHRQAFAKPDGDEPVELRLVHALRSDGGWVPALSLIAEGAGGAVMGHVVCTEGSVGSSRVVGLGPIGVLPANQRAGVGRALMHAVIAAADALDYPAVILLGDLDYYLQFGFVPASRLGVYARNAHWGDHFQARPLAAWHAGVGGVFRYATPFEAL
jgi:putative acetyltransferase